MLQNLRKRLERDEQGFTLIELMVVVLIIAILLAIAIPTFLGARDRANNRAAQSSLRNALSAAKTLFTDSQDYKSATESALDGIEPALTFENSTTASGTFKVVSVDENPSSAAAGTASSNWAAAAKSKTGTCYYIYDSTAAGGGTMYAKSAAASCTAASAPDPGDAAWKTDVTVGW